MLGKRRTFLLFIRRLPYDLTQNALRAFVLSELKAASISLPVVRNTITHCEILRIVDQQTGQVEHHGLVEIGPPRMAIRAIEILNGKQIHGHRISVHRYQHRGLWRNQTETSNGHPPPGGERRRPNLKRDLVRSTEARGLFAAWSFRRQDHQSAF